MNTLNIVGKGKLELVSRCMLQKRMIPWDVANNSHMDSTGFPFSVALCVAP